MGLRLALAQLGLAGHGLISVLSPLFHQVGSASSDVEGAQGKSWRP